MNVLNTHKMTLPPDSTVTRQLGGLSVRLSLKGATRACGRGKNANSFCHHISIEIQVFFQQMFGLFCLFMSIWNDSKQISRKLSVRKDESCK